VDLLKRFPAALLGVMVIASGLELVSVGESLNTSDARDLANSRHVLSEDECRKRWTVMMVTVGLLVGFKNDAVGFLAGMLCHWAYTLPVIIEKAKAQWGEGRIRV
jgi:hypothetical protein